VRKRIADMRRGCADGDSGMTLVELLVTCVILSMVTATAYGILISVMKQSRDLQGRQETVGQARLALEQMDRQIRSGNVLFDPANEYLIPNGMTNSMRVYTQANGAERCVQWNLTATGNLRSRSWSPTWQTDNLVTGWGVVARGIVNGGIVTAGSPFSLETTAGTAYGGRLLNIKLDVRDSNSKGTIQTVSTSLSGRNTEYGYDKNICSPIPPA
jgi:prepilin-type N-terminal cleavage/methylation domain-containing protein